MLIALTLMLFGTFLWEQAAIKIKKYKELDVFQKAILIPFFQALISITFWYLFGWLHFELNAVSFAIAIATILLTVWFYYYAMKTIETADRSTASIFSVLVLPMLLVSDIILWYDITMYQVVWVLFITLVLLYSSYSGTLNMKWFKYIIITTLIAFVSTMIFKYQISHYASVYSQLFIQSFFAMLIAIWIVYKKMWLAWLKWILKKDYIIIWAVRWTNTMLTSLAYMFGPASIISSFKRICAMFWWVIFGKLVFHETQIWKKMANVAVLSFWIFIMNFQTIAANINWVKNIQTSILKSDINGKVELKPVYYVPPSKLPEQLKKSDIMVWF